MTTIEKVHHTGKTVDIRYAEVNGTSRSSLALSSNDAPRPEFNAALQALLRDVLEICEFATPYGKTIRISGVTFTDKKGTTGAVISAVKKLEGANAPLNIHTPHLTEAPASHKEQHTAKTLSSGCLKRLETLRQECVEYIKGNRAQGTLGLVEEASGQ